MKINTVTHLIALSAATCLLPACRPVGEAVGSATRTVYTGHSGGAYGAKNTDRYQLENQSKFVLLDHYVQRSVTQSGFQESVLPDGRLEVAANIRNRLARRIQVEVQCVFKDVQGFSTGDETPWQTLILTESSQETVRFTAMNDKAKGYTVRVRQAH